MLGLAIGVSLQSAGLRVQAGPGGSGGETPPDGPLVIAVWQQSEHAQALVVNLDNNMAVNGLTYEPLVDQDKVTFWWHDRTTGGGQVAPPETGVRSVVVNDANVAAGAATSGLTRTMVAMANEMMRSAPGQDIHLVMQVRSGTSPVQIMQGDAQGPVSTASDRYWPDDWALNAEFERLTGLKVQYAYHSWFASPGTWGNNYGENMIAFIKGTDLGGAPLDYSAGPVDVNGIAVARSLRDIYEPAVQWVRTPGAHMFAPVVDMDNGETGVGDNNSRRNKQRSTVSWRAAMNSPALSDFWAPHETFPLMAYSTGQDNGDGITWGDEAHPSRTTPDGHPRFARLTAAAIARGIGLTAYNVPEWDNAAWQEDGSYVEVWSSAGPITTVRHARGEGFLAGDVAVNGKGPYPHWTNVLGWEIDGVPAERAEVQPDGRVRIYPNSGSFTSGTTLAFGTGGGSGMLIDNDDLFAELWKDYPIVDVGLAAIEGIPLRPLPDPAVLQSTIGGGTTAPDPVDTFQTSDAGPTFVDPGPKTSAGLTQVTLLFKGSLDADQAASTATLAGASGRTFAMLAIRNNGGMRLQYRREGGSYTQVSTPANAFTPGTPFTAMASFNLDTGWARIWVDGSLLHEENIGIGGAFQVGRDLLFLSTGTGQNQFKGRVERLAIWMGTASSDGTEPAAAPYKDISGTPVIVNADPWKQGADAT